MYLHLGQDTVVRKDSVLGVFDLDNSTQSYLTRNFLREEEKKGEVFSVTEDLPKSFVLCEEDGKTKIFLSQLSPATLQKRAAETLTITDF